MLMAGQLVHVCNSQPLNKGIFIACEASYIMVKISQLDFV